jgi:hypothetical protein
MLDPRRFRDAQLRFIIRNRLAFQSVTWTEYQDLLLMLNPRVQPMLINSAQTITSDLLRSFETHQKSVLEKLT